MLYEVITEGQKSLIYGRRSFEIEEIYQIIIPFTEFLKSANADILVITSYSIHYTKLYETLFSLASLNRDSP